MRWLLAIGELALLVWFFVVGLEAMMQRRMGMRSPFRLREFHHFHIGLLLVLFGFWLNSVTGCFLELLGIVLGLDDLYQHMRQTFDGMVEYQSPLHRWFGRVLWPKRWVQQLVHFLDAYWPIGAVLGLLALWLAT